LYEVGLAKDLRKEPAPYTQVHHAPQSAQAESLIGDYRMANEAGNEAAIRVSDSEHIAINAAQASRSTVPASARDLLAQDIRILQNNTKAPNSALKKLIKLNKKLQESDFTK